MLSKEITPIYLKLQTFLYEERIRMRIVQNLQRQKSNQARVGGGQCDQSWQFYALRATF